MPNLINEMMVRAINQALDGSEGMLIVSMTGLTVAETEGLRNALAEHGLRLRMVRNRLALRALKEHELEPVADTFVGNIACVWGGSEDAIAAAKALHNSDARKQGKVALRGGLFEGNLLDADGAKALASLPGREELHAMMAGLVASPVRNVVGLLQAPVSAIARVLQARADALGSPAEGGAEEGSA